MPCTLLKIQDDEIELVDRYVYLGHEISIGKELRIEKNRTWMDGIWNSSKCYRKTYQLIRRETIRNGKLLGMSIV